jgi:hypothetical protein
MNGEPVEPNYTDDFQVGKSYALTAEAYEGYRFVGWNIYGEMSYSFVEEASFTLVTKADERDIVAIFEPVVTGLTVDMDTVIYDISLLEKYESISIPEFNAICKELGENKSGTTDYVITGKIKSISNTTWGNMIIVDDEGNEYGKIVDVMQPGGNDVYVFRDRRREVLVPALKTAILKVDLEARVMLMSAQRLREVAVFDEV